MVRQVCLQALQPRFRSKALLLFFMKELTQITRIRMDLQLGHVIPLPLCYDE